MKRKTEIITIASIIIIFALLYVLGSFYPAVDEFNLSDFITDFLVVILCLGWITLIKGAITAKKAILPILAGLFLMLTGFYVDLIDEIFDIEGLLNNMESIGLLFGMVLVSIGLYIQFKYTQSFVKAKEAETEKLYRASIFDSLTGLYNRNYFNEFYEEYLRNRVLDEEVYLVLIDVDNFKEVNDQFGHHEGDLQLMKIARGLKKYVSSDMVIRYGGDEFLLFYHGMEKEVVIDDMKCLKKYMENQVKNELIGLSIGITKERPEESFTTCFQRADSAMYQAKKSNENFYTYVE